MIIDALKGINTAIAFFLELAMLIAFGYWGFHGEKSTWLKWLLGIGIPLIVIVAWGFWMAPRSEYRLGLLPGVIVSSILFLLAAAALYQTGQTTLATIMAVITIVHEILVLLWRQW